jgi:Viral alkaline exonuclease
LKFQKANGKRCAAVDELFHEEEFNPFEDAALEDAKKHLLRSLEENNHPKCNLPWLLQDEPTDVATDSNYSILHIVQQHREDIDDPSAMLQHFKLSDKEVTSIEESTRGQRCNPLWSVLRQNRLTASNFGKVLKAVANNTCSSSLLAQLQGKFCYNMQSKHYQLTVVIK